MRACSASTAEGTLWPVDAALRPEGKSGPLVRTLASHRQYYERWAKTWEFQALLKARPIAGDPELGEAYMRRGPPAGLAGGRPRQLRRGRPGHAPPGRAARPGGRGRPPAQAGPGRAARRRVQRPAAAARARPGRRVPALAARPWRRSPRSSSGGYVGRDDAAALDEAYRLLRTLEHRIQLYRLRRTHLMPTDEADLRRLGRAIGHRRDAGEGGGRAVAGPGPRGAPASTSGCSTGRCSTAAARLSTEEARLTPEAARDRLAALGFRDPAGAMRHIEALTAGVSRRAAIQRTLLPVMLGWFADEADPDAGLLAFRRVSEALGTPTGT